MSLINLSVKHGRTMDEARNRLEMALTEVPRTSSSSRNREISGIVLSLQESHRLTVVPR
jgi:hypothetical protein